MPEIGTCEHWINRHTMIHQIVTQAYLLMEPMLPDVPQGGVLSSRIVWVTEDLTEVSRCIWSDVSSNTCYHQDDKFIKMNGLEAGTRNEWLNGNRKL